MKELVTPQVSGNSLEDEDSLAATPFLLASGLAYRDMLTISAARLVAQFGLNHNRTQPRTFKPIFRWGTAGFQSSDFCEILYLFTNSVWRRRAPAPPPSSRCPPP